MWQQNAVSVIMLVSEPGMNLLIQEATFINRHIAEAKKLAGVEGA